VSVDDSILAHISQSLLHHTETVSVECLPFKRLVVAFSGGVDSTVLLHGLVAAATQSLIPYSMSSIVAIHINHQLSPQSDAWQQHCQQYAEDLGLMFYSERVTVVSSGKGVESAARDARYQVFERFLQADDGLLLGHHQGDQAETVLLRLFRGAGVKGLSAMPKSRTIGPCTSARTTGQAQLVRPLLTLSQEAITAYAQQNQLLWVEDESNQSDRYDRNFLRNKVVPSLVQRWPAVVSQLSKTAETMTQTNALLADIAADDLQQLDHQKARTDFSIDFALLNRLSLPRKNNVLRHWCEKNDYAQPDTDQLAQIEQQFFSREDLLSSACVSWAQYELRQFSGRLYLMQAVPRFISPPTIEWDGVSDLDLQDAGMLCVNSSDSLNPNKETTKTSVRIKQQPYQIRWRQGGERCTPTGRQHSQTVKKLLQEYGLETWLRGRVPLIYCGNDLVAVGDLWVNKGYEVGDAKDSVSVFWKCI
jgi:tRNA(Ile)-lysidine synthase